MKKKHQRYKKRKYSAYKVAIAIVLTLFLLLIGNKAYELYVLHQEIVNAEQIKQQVIEDISQENKIVIRPKGSK